MAAHDIYLSDMRGKQVGLTLQDGALSIGQDFVSEESLGVTLRAVGKKIGDFDEQNDWKGGRGGERLIHEPTRYFDSKDVWTLSPNHVLPTLEWKFARGLRGEDTTLDGSKEFKPIFGDNRYLCTFITPDAFTVKNAYAWIRKVGNPGDLTFQVYSLTAPAYNALNFEKFGSTISADDVDDILSVLYHFEDDNGDPIGSDPKYALLITVSATDDSVNHWEIACDTTGTSYANSSTGGAVTSWPTVGYSPYFRLTDEDVDRRFWFFYFKSCQYAVDQKADGTASQLYRNGWRGVASSGSATTLVDTGIGWTADRMIGAYVRIIAGTGKGQVRAITDNTTDTLTVATWDVTVDNTSEYVVYGTEYWSEIGTTGLGEVLHRPIVANNVAYFPQGSGDNIREMQISSGVEAFGDQSTNKADVLLTGYDNTGGVQVFRALDNEVSRASVVAFGAALVFGTAIAIGDTEYPITNMIKHGNMETGFSNQTYIFKSDSIWRLSGDVATDLGYGIQDVPDSRNGQAAKSFNKFLYFNWMYSVERDYGGTLDDVGQGWRNPPLPDGREGRFSSFISYVALLFGAIDADDGTSSIMAWDGFGWHEIARAYEAGRRIRDLAMQPCEGTRPRLWFDCGGDILYQVFPKGKANPLYDSGVDYMHEAVIESAAIDMGTASRLPKFIGRLTAFTKNLGPSIYLGASYQVDDNVGTNNWTNLSSFTKSPEDEVTVNAENIGRFAYRLILRTNDNNTPPDIQGVVPSGFARSPFRRVWNIRIKTGEGFTKLGTKDIPQDELVSWLYDAARFPGRVLMKSDSFDQLDNRRVIIVPPQINPTVAADIGVPEKAVLTLKIIEA